MRESGRTIEIQGYNWFYRWLLYVLHNLVPSVFPGGFLVKFGFAPLICWLRYVTRTLFWDEPTTLGNPENPIRRRILFHRRIRYAFSRTQSNPSVCNKPYHKIFRSLCEKREKWKTQFLVLDISLECRLGYRSRNFNILGYFNSFTFFASPLILQSGYLIVLWDYKKRYKNIPISHYPRF